MALSKDFRVCDSYARAEQFCNDVEANKVPAGALLAMLKRKILSVVTFAGGALNIFYQKSEDLALASVDVSLGLYKADASALNFFRISAITVPFASIASLSKGDDGVYNPIASKEGFLRIIKNVERATTSRNYLLELGNDTMEIYVHAAANYSGGLTAINVTYKRTPDVSFTLDDARDPSSSIYMDTPSFYVPHVEMATAIEALKQAGIKENQMSGLVDEHKEVLAALNQMHKGEEADLKARGADQ